MQESDNITMARDIQQYGLKINQLWLNGYDRSLLNQYSSLMKGVYLNVNGAVPYEAAGGKYGNTYPGMQTYIAQMNKSAPTFTYNGTAPLGWQAAALLVQGDRQVGDQPLATHSGQPDQRHQYDQRRQRRRTTATVTKWTTAHTIAVPPYCSAFVQVKGTQFVPVFGTGQPGVRLPRHQEQHAAGHPDARHSGNMSGPAAGFR